MWLVAMSRCVVRSGCVGWIGRWPADPCIHRSTPYYKVLLRYYSVLQSTTPVLVRTTKYYSSTNSVLQSTTPVLLCTTKYQSSTTLYYNCTTPVLLQYYSVLQSTIPVLLCTTKYYSSTILYYKVLLQYYSVLQLYYSILHRSIPVQLRTTKYYSSTTPYYTDLLQYYTVPQSTTPVLVRTTKYYSSTSPYYKVLLQYYSVLKSTSPVLLCTTIVLLQYYSVLQSTTPVLLCTTKYYSILLCTTKYYSSTTLYYKVLLRTTLYYKVLLQYYSVLQSTTPAPLLVLQSTHLQGAEHHRHQRHQMLCLPRKVTLMIDLRHIWNFIYNAQSNRTHRPTSPNTAPATQNDSHEWCPSHMKRHLQCAEQQVSYTNVTKYCACHVKWLASLILVKYETSFTMRGATDVIQQRHQVLRLPRKMTRIIDPRGTWNVIYNARSNRHHPPTSPNTAPATQNCTPKSKRNLPKTIEASFTMAHDSRMIRPWSDHEIAKLNPSVRRAYFSPLGNAFCIEIYNISCSGYLPRFHQILSLPRKVTLQDHQILRLPRKMTLMIDPRHIWNVIYNARSNRTPPPTSPSIVPATQNDSHERCPSHMKLHLQCAEQQDSSSNVIKYCTCHAKWLSWLMSVAYETSFTMREATGITLQPHQMLRLPRKMTRTIDPRDIWNVIYTARSNRHHPPTSPNAAPATQNCIPKSKRNCPKTVEVSFTMRDRFGHDSRVIRPWTRHLAPARSPRWLSRFGHAFSIENYNVSRSGYLPRFHRILRLPQKVTLQHHQMLRLPRKVTLQDHQRLRLPRKVALQDHQILRLPRKMTLMIDVRRIWNVIYNARSNRTPPPTSPSIVPATQRLSWVMSVTSFTMRGTTGLILQRHQILHLPRKMTLLSDVRHISNVICNARSNRHHPPTSPNAAPATQNCIPKSQRNCLKTVEVSFTMRDRFEHDPRMIRPWTRHLAPARSPRWLFRLRTCIFYWKLQHFTLRLSTQIPNTAPATKRDTPTSPNAAPATKSHAPRSPNTAPDLFYKKWHPKITKCCACHEKWPWTVTWLHSYLDSAFTELLLDWAVTTELLLDRTVTWLNCYLTKLLLYCAVTLLNCYLTQLILYWAVTLLSCYFTELLLDWAVTLLSRYFTELLLYWAVTWLSCYLTEMLLYWAVTLLSCYLTELLLCWAVTLLSCYFTELLLDWALTLLNCYFTELLLYWAVTLLRCYFTELLLYGAVTLLSCYFPELLLYWAVTLLSCYFTGLFAFLNLRNSEVSQRNFLWSEYGYWCLMSEF